MKASRELLPKFEEAPELLVGKQVLHQAEEEGEGLVQWFEAKVIAIAEAHRKPLDTKYVIKYDIEPPEQSWTFPLLKDLKKGDLIIV